CILAILFVIASEVYPLFRPPSAHLAGRYAPAIGGEPAPGRSMGVDEYRVLAFAIMQSGVVEVVPLASGVASPPRVPIPGLDGARVASVADAGRGRYVVGTDDGRVIPLEMKFDVTFKDGVRSVTPAPAAGAPSSVDPDTRRPVKRLAAASPDSGVVRVA